MGAPRVRLTPSGLTPHTVALEPSRDFDLWRAGHEGSEGTRSQVLARFLLENADAVVESTHNVTRKLAGNSALVGSAPYGTWARVVDPDGAVRYPESGGVSVPAAVRNAFALDTCAGCHRHETDTRHFMHVTVVGAMEPASKVDDRARIGVGPETPEDATVLSNFLAAEVSPGGGRFEDYAWLLSASIAELVNKKGLRACR